MKAKLETGILVIVMILDAYLLNLNINVDRYQNKKNIQSTANYMNVETIENMVDKEIIEETDNNIDLTTEKVSEVIPKDPIVYDGLTLNELSDKLNKSLNSTISGKGNLIAEYALKKGVDPYMAVGIILQETGCAWECSYLVKSCNNVGGQVGSGCNGYSYFNSLDEGIMAFIDNLYNKFISYGLTTPELINPKYASDKGWSLKVNKYIEIIKAR